MTRRSDGRWCESITLADGRRKYFYGKSKTEVLIKLNEYKDLKEKPPLFETVAREWYESYVQTHTPERVKHINCVYRRAVEQFGDRRIDTIEPIEIQLFLHSLKDEGFGRGSLITQKTVLKKIFNHEILSKDAHIRYNPVSEVETPRVQKRKKHSATPEQEEIVRRSVGLPFGLFAFLLLYTGCRSGEARALRWGDIDFTHDIIHIERAVTNANLTLEIKSPKTENGVRDIPLLPPLRTELLKVEPRPAREYIFGGKHPLSCEAVRWRWSKYVEKAGLGELTPHQLRHSYATMCLEAELSPEDAQYLLGHADIQTTVNIYADIRESKRQIANEKLARFTDKF